MLFLFKKSLDREVFIIGLALWKTRCSFPLKGLFWIQKINGSYSSMNATNKQEVLSAFHEQRGNKPVTEETKVTG